MRSVFGFLVVSLVSGLLACTRQPETKVVFIGIDGASWKVIGELLDQGELPTFRRLVKEGAYASSFETISTTRSPAVWTSVATGRSPADHGIRDFVDKLPSGERIPVSSNSRRAKAIWEVASEHDVSVGVIGWWASWPAEAVKGYVVTDHANPALSDFLVDDGRYWTADPTALRAMDLGVYPSELAPSLLSSWIPADEFPFEDLRRRGGFSSQQMSILQRQPWNRRNYYSLLKTFYRVDYPLFAAAQDLARRRPTRLQMLYLRGPDPIQHYAWDLVEPEKYEKPRPSRVLERDRGLVEGVYRYIDSFLAELQALDDPNTWVLVASDHGAEPSKAATGSERKGRPGAHTPSAKGVLFLHGPHVKQGYVLDGVDPYDLFPTMAWLLELPLSEELEGDVLREAFEETFVRSQSLTRVAFYGPRETGALMRSDEDDSMLESLRALGYIQ